MIYAEHLLPFGSLKLLCELSGKCLHDYSPMKTSGDKAMNLPREQQFIFVTAYPGGIKHMLKHSVRKGSSNINPYFKNS